MLLIDDEKNHVMRTSLSEFGSAILVWPKGLTVKWLTHAREMVVFQLDTMIEGAKRKTARQEAADAEWNSWFGTTASGSSNNDRSDRPKQIDATPQSTPIED